MGRQKLAPLTTPPSVRGIPRWIVFFGGVVGFIYMLNPTAGLIELIPDNIPIVGNLDEGVAMLLIWYSIIEFIEGGDK